MIAHLPLRLIASTVTLAAVLPSPPVHTQTVRVVPPPAPVVLPHISVQAFGQGSPVLLIPGLASPRETWANLVPALQIHHRLILVQVNGFGGDPPGANLRPGVLAGIVEDLHGYLAREQLGSAAVIGHSLGGLVAMMLAKAHPDDVGKLMIVDSLPFFAVLMAPPGVDPTPAMVAPQAALMRDRIAAHYGTPLTDAEADAQTKGLALKPGSVALMKRWAARADPRVTAEAMYEDLTTDLRPDLGAIRTPITLVYPTSADKPDALVAPVYRRAFGAAPHVAYVPIADSGHFAMLDQPQAFAAAVDAFLR